MIEICDDRGNKKYAARRDEVRRREREDSARRAVYSYGELSLTADTHAASVSAASVSLTRTEYAILKLLMQNPEQIISREVMLERISEDTPDCTEGSLKTHVSHLRGKLRRVGGRDFIETVRGAGFSLSKKSCEDFFDKLHPPSILILSKCCFAPKVVDVSRLLDGGLLYLRRALPPQAPPLLSYPRPAAHVL